MRQPFGALSLALAFWGASACKPLPAKKDARRTGVLTGSGSAVASGTGDIGSSGSEGTGTGSSGTPLGVMNFTVQVSLTSSAAPPPVSFESVRDIVVNRCGSCHGAAATLDLSAWPFKSRFVTPVAAVEEMLARIQDASRPMPPLPYAPLPSAEIDALKDWQSGGLKEKPEAIDTVAFAETITTRVKAHAVRAAQDAEQTFAWNATAQFSGTLTMPVDDTLTIAVSLVGEDGVEIAAKTYENIPVAAEGVLRFYIAGHGDAIRAHVVDKLAPTAGGEGVVAASSVDETELSIAWTPATDQLTAAAGLSYAVFIANDTVATAEQVVASGRKAVDFTKGLSSAKIAALERGHTYMIVVVVKDEAGNQSLYKILKQATVTDRVPPTVPTAGLTSTNLTEARVSLAWSAAQDNLSPPAKISYEVYASSSNDMATLADTMAHGVKVGATAPGILTLNVGGLVPSTVYYFNVVAVDEFGNRAIYSPLRVATPAPDGTVQTVVDHGRQCAERLGTVKPFSCFDGQIMPISVDGSVIPANLSAQQAGQYSFGNTTASQFACDRPALLGLGSYGHCIPYARVGTLKSFKKDGTENPNVDTVFTCRHYTPRLGPSTWLGQSFDGSQFPGFEDVAMIMHDRVSGETCFFQMLDLNSKDGRRIPPPTEPSLPAGAPSYAVKANDFWLSPVAAASKNCNRCHDSDPWMHSPYIDQVRAADGRPLVPSGAFGGGRSGKYSVIGSRGFYNWQKSQAIASTVTSDTNGKSCTSCHNIGSLNTCASWARQSAGVDLGPNLTAMAKTTFAYKYWMPPVDQGAHSFTEWQTSGFKRAAERLIDCCINPQQTGCSAAPVMTTPPPYAF